MEAVNKVQRSHIEGTKNLSTDDNGIERFRALRRRYPSDEELAANVALRKNLRIEVQRLYIELKKEGRLWRRDGTRV